MRALIEHLRSLVEAEARGTVPPDHETPSEEGYVYHASNVERAHGVAEHGIKVHKPGEYTDQETWPDGSTEKRNYFSHKAHVVHSFAPEEGPHVILRVHSKNHEFKRESGTGDTYSKKTVHPKHVEILTHKGWHPVQKWSKGETSECVEESYQPTQKPMGKMPEGWKGPRWKRPNLGKERREITMHAKEFGMKRADLHKAIKGGTLGPLSKKHWKKLDNTWSWGVGKKHHEKWAKEIGRNTDRIDQGFKEGSKMPAPIVVHRPSKRPYVVAGNTRLAASYVHGVQPQVVHVHLPGKKK